MQDYAFNCPKCEASLVVSPPDGPGSEIECPECKRPITIPAPPGNRKKIVLMSIALVVLGVVAYKQYAPSGDTKKQSASSAGKEQPAPPAAVEKVSPPPPPPPPPAPVAPAPATNASQRVLKPVEEIRRGDTRSQVIKRLGNPGTRMAQGNKENFLYPQAEITLTDGIVTDIQMRAPRSTSAASRAK